MVRAVRVTDNAGLREFQLMGDSRIVMKLDIDPMKNPELTSVLEFALCPVTSHWL
jgi:hypothetical protein